MSFKKSVRFADESMNIIFTYEAPDDPKSMWISNESRQRSETGEKAEARREAMASGIAILLEETFAKPHLEAQYCLNEFVRTGGARGIERSICHSLFTERKFYKSEVLRSVFVAQAVAKHKGWSPNKIDESVREASMKSSFKAKLWARKMGVADEAACFAVWGEETRRMRSIPHKTVGMVRALSSDRGCMPLLILGCC